MRRRRRSLSDNLVLPSEIREMLAKHTDQTV
jgi:hypothetical protein